MLHHGYRPKYKLIVASIVLTLTTIVPSTAKNPAISSPLIRCLAQEELALHKKKITGPIYTLNQTFINDMASFGGATLKPGLLKKVCADKMKVSTTLLEIIITQGQRAFVDRSRSENLFIKASLNSLLERAPFIFFRYISDVQSIFPTAHCLESELPEIPYFIYRFKYLQSDIKPSELLDDKNKVRIIFKRLEKLSPMLKRCQRKLEKKLKKMKTN